MLTLDLFTALESQTYLDHPVHITGDNQVGRVLSADQQAGGAYA